MPTAPTIVADNASRHVLFASNQTININDRIAIAVPPGKRNTADGNWALRRSRGRATHVAPYVTNLAIALIVRAATNELLSVKTSISAAVMRMETWGVKKRR